MELTIQHLTKKFQDTIAVKDISFVMEQGIYGLLGANGAGKTTLMQMLCSVQRPTSGNILLDGQDIHNLDEHYRDILGYLPQTFGYYPDFNAMDFLIYIGVLKGYHTNAAKQRAEELLEMVGLQEVKKKRIKTFSGGMIQRLGIAQAVINDPKILVLDEPTAGLDPKERVRFRNIISSFSKDRIIVLSTHIVSDIEYIADQILIMKKGKLLAQGSVDDILTKAQNAVWECVVGREEVEKLNQQYCISNLKNERLQVRLRIVSKRKPHPNAIQIQPTLEDLYLYENEGGI